MRYTVGTTSKRFPAIIGKDRIRLVEDRDGSQFRLTLQNLGTVDIYMENGEDVTIEKGYKLKSGNEVEIPIKRIQNLYLMADGSDNDNLRVITT